jgi:hypothetical protein
MYQHMPSLLQKLFYFKQGICPASANRFVLLDAKAANSVCGQCESYFIAAARTSADVI